MTYAGSGFVFDKFAPVAIMLIESAEHALGDLTEMMRTNTRFHADQAGRHVGRPGFDLATRPLLPHHDGTATIKTDNVEPVLADINADNGNRTTEILRHGVLLVFGAPCQLPSLAGQEHGRTIPLAVMHGR
jgi:hypothetical protein